MTNFTPAIPDFEARVRSSFKLQGIMNTFGAELAIVLPGEVHIDLPFSQAVTQQHGFVHAGIITTIVDSACGYAAYTLMPADTEVLTVEYKANFLSPAKGEKFTGIGRVIKPGRSITVCQGEVWAHDNGRKNLVALLQTTMMTIQNKI